VTVELLHGGQCEVLLAPPGEPPLSADVERAVTGAWELERTRRPGLFNGALLSAVEVSAGRLLVRECEYRHFVAQRSQPELAKDLRVNPVAVSGLVVTSDGRWLFGHRGAGVTQFPLHFEAVPSGTLDARAFGGQAPKAGLALDPVSCLLAELSEEAGIDAEAVGSIRPLGLLLDVEERTYDLAYLVQLQRSAAHLSAHLLAAEASLEYQRLRPLSPDEVAAEMAQPLVVPTTRRLWDMVQGKGAS
jgi:hypothetical protein